MIEGRQLMVDVSGEATWFDSALGNGIMLRSPGPVARAIQAAHDDGFRKELVRLNGFEDGIEIEPYKYGTVAIIIPGTDHQYWAYSGLAYEYDIDTDFWTAHVVVSYTTEEESYPVLEEKHKVGVYRNPVFCAALAVNAVKAHRAAGFTELRTEPKYGRYELARLDREAEARHKANA